MAKTEVENGEEEEEDEEEEEEDEMVVGTVSRNLQSTIQSICLWIINKIFKWTRCHKD